MALKRADESHKSTSNDKLRLLMEACIRVPTTSGGDAYSCNACPCGFRWNLQLLSGVLNNGVKFFGVIGRNIVIFPL